MLVTALATPYKEGKIDCYSYEKLIDFQLKQGVDALLALGTTAEASLLDGCEKKLLLRIAKGMASKHPVWVGVEIADTRRAAEFAETAQKLGADGILLAPPAFVKCTCEGFFSHVKTVAEAVTLPIMLYNAPSRCGYTLDLKTLYRLTDVVSCLKDAGSDLDYTQSAAEKMTVLCGNDPLLSKMLERGAKGAVSVVSNVAPQLTRKMIESTATEKEKTLFDKLAKLSMSEINPICIKYMLYKAGIFDSFDVRLPLTNASKKSQKHIDRIMGELV